MDKVDGSAPAGDFERSDIEMTAQSVQISGVHFTEVGALGVSSSDQSIELFDTAFVTGPVGPGKEHATWSAQRSGDLGVSGKLSAVVQSE